MEQPQDAGRPFVAPTQPASTGLTGRTGRYGPLGYGLGPITAVGVIVGGALVFAGWGVVNMVHGQPTKISAAVVQGGTTPATQATPATPSSAQARPTEIVIGTDVTKPKPQATAASPTGVTAGVPGVSAEGVPTVTVVLPDHDRDGIPDSFETPLPTPPTPTDSGPTDSGHSPHSKNATNTPNRDGYTVHTIQRGETLSVISGATGVPVGILVAYNKIADPDLIYAGAALRIPNT